MAYSFDGLNVVSFESRRSKEIAKLIEYHGGTPVLAPSMREVPLSDSVEALEFADDLIAGKIDIVVLLTGVGTKALVKVAATKYSLNEFAAALSKVVIVARGPKPVAALKEISPKGISLRPTVTVPEPNTWKDLVETIESTQDINGKTVAVQEYGVSNPELNSALEELGAVVMVVPVYKWALPEDLSPLKSAIKSISNGEVDIALFTSAQQIRHLLEVASEDGMEEKLRSGLRRTVIGSIGPTTTEVLHELGLAADYEPDSPKMGNLVKEMARSGGELLRKKRLAADNSIDTSSWSRIDMRWPEDGIERADITYQNSQFLKACRREKTDYTPIWIMRQAGRFLREYREMRAKVSFLELCKTPELAAEVTLMAVDRLGVDAAIIFSDILLILESIGIEIEYSKGDGPVIHTEIRSGDAVDRLVEFETESLQYVYDALSMTRRSLDPNIALIGFAGAPFTLASYAIEGGGSRNYINTKRMMYFDPGAWDALMQRLTDSLAKYLNAQIDAGADTLQLFDSWVGCLGPDDYRQFVKPHMKRLFEQISGRVPVIHFGTGTATFLSQMKEAGGDVIGLDWRMDLAKTWQSLGSDVAVQGNLDPTILFASRSYVCQRAEGVIDEGLIYPGHIFNLGHGVLPKTPVDNVLALVDHVHEYSAKKKG